MPEDISEALPGSLRTSTGKLRAVKLTPVFKKGEKEHRGF